MIQASFQCAVRLQSGWRCKSKKAIPTRAAVKKMTSVSAAKPDQEPQKILSCYVPFQVGDRVCLRMIPSRAYTVVCVCVNVPLGDTSCHLMPGSESEANHYYHLISSSGIPAYWWHSQLQIFQPKVTA